MTQLLNAAPLLITLVCVAVTLVAAHWFLLASHPDMGNGRKFPRQLIMLGLTISGAIAIAITLPVSDSTRNQIIALIGVLLSGVLAFSSSSVLANLMAGILLRMTRAFRTGDFMRVGDYFGRVAERGLFDVEIQTEQRELVSLSNSFLMANPITVIRSSGAIVQATLSLGYDVHHAKVEPLLLQAASDIGLQEGFTQILELGDYSITYRISGLLVEVDNLLTARSDLFRQVLDVLHGAGIEIMSPSFMSQRPLPPGQSILPVPEAAMGRVKRTRAEDVVFDKAEEAQAKSRHRHTLAEQVRALEAKITDSEGSVRTRLAADLEQVKAQLVALQDEGNGDASA